MLLLRSPDDGEEEFGAGQILPKASRCKKKLCWISISQRCVEVKIKNRLTPSGSGRRPLVDQNTKNNAEHVIFWNFLGQGGVAGKRTDDMGRQGTS